MPGHRTAGDARGPEVHVLAAAVYGARVGENFHTGGGAAAHWDSTYGGGDADRSWYAPRATIELELLSRHRPALPGVVDVGGGASTFADDMLGTGQRDITVLDVSATGMAIARRRLGGRAADVEWLVADVRDWRPERSFGLWHDRAVLHFLVEPAERDAYRAALDAATAPGSLVIIAAFAPDGPAACSGLPVRRYAAGDLVDFLGPRYEVLETFERAHITPAGRSQQFQWAMARRAD